MTRSLTLKFLTIIIFVAGLFGACAVETQDSVIRVKQQPVAAFNVDLWPNGVVCYDYTKNSEGDELGGSESSGTGDKGTVRAAMDAWEDALTTNYGTSTTKVLQFVRCNDDSSNSSNHCENKCPNYVTTYRIRPKQPSDGGTYASSKGLGVHCPELPEGSEERENCEESVKTATNRPRLYLTPGFSIVVALHELGHGLGLGHQQLRSDRARYYLNDGNPGYPSATHTSRYPVTDPFNYDSVRSGPAAALSRTGATRLTG